MKQGQYSELGNSQYQLMTSVSMPIYDLRHNEVSLSMFGIFLFLNVLIFTKPPSINRKDNSGSLRKRMYYLF